MMADARLLGTRVVRDSHVYRDSLRRKCLLLDPVFPLFGQTIEAAGATPAYCPMGKTTGRLAPDPFASLMSRVLASTARAVRPICSDQSSSNSPCVRPAASPRIRISYATSRLLLPEEALNRMEKALT
ncbi:hypothetical protein FHS42_000145 [Streptomyces zagrosensis]|uniref:Uncharacterized protein n=1 Tax=Streptomyces zagrosensis TaxID=1042984 RepID=A0A7W9Q5T9_9ACTN|nr:hypothetical protein [Streptomyces zagrosensis]